MPVYRPRALLRLTVPLPTGDGFEPFTYDVDVSRVRLERNDHNHADSLDVEVDWIDAGVDPRWIAGGTCELYMGSADDFGDWGPSDDNLRFVGRMVRPARELRSDSLRVSLLFHDYTSFFLLAKPFASSGVPLYSDTLQAAWARICDQVPGVEALKDNLEFRGLSAPGPRVSSAVAARFQKLGKVPVKPGVDAWAVWQQVVGMMGLISFFEGDRCVVTTATDYFTGSSTPALVYGRNILNFREERNNDRGIRGVGITSYDPLTGKSLEAIYDPLAGKRKAKKPAAKKKGGAKTALVDTTEVDFFQFPGVTNPEQLEVIARRVYEERSRQELEGSVSTADMTASTTTGDEADLLSLRSGDTIEVRFMDSEDAAFVRVMESVGDRTAYLVDRGYSEPVANIIAANVDRMTDKSSLFYVKSMTVDMESTEDGGSFNVDIQFINKIDPKGGSAGAS